MTNAATDKSVASVARDVSTGKPGKSPDAAVHLLSGGLAGLTSAVTLQPFDLLKTRLQQQHSETSKLTIAGEIRKLSQLKELWRGAVPSALRTSVGAGLYFTTLSKMRAAVAQYNHRDSSVTSVLPKLLPMENLATGFVARAIVGYITMPITMVKTRFESNIYSYRTMGESIVGIYKDIGPDGVVHRSSLLNFFKGSVATLARDCPYAGLYVLFYEGFKNDVLVKVIPESVTGSDSRSSVINSSSAILAASVSTTITAPFDAIKTRLQLTKETSILKTTGILLREDGGVFNLFRGLSLRFGRKALSAGISWCIYEELIKSDFSQCRLFNKERLA
ncbi:predicted protein [Scheffersomyces stipitis CBS 6054]|uniref:Mitochondrial glycine transporter n=1 Tax=Scheffersomyces stipitis (strain ATCC 58785 / CBS 6054 / NBRC 10063 / NRRL Y-11545) TaxID=322104 RepID=S2538_PICST|nr:predicted protein [Scheffersomyces stipitis CBS 6054]A3M019.2 RecName: Full=Mitochondrial glycine transporter; AltName: Full=Solute carrier family 25 member 38 homolog [Scheffersomyces stipitis CBS 6054]ABN68440.2 predicted protein [Scheffersomyces stipitis CBS 6054]